MVIFLKIGQSEYISFFNPYNLMRLLKMLKKASLLHEPDIIYLSPSFPILFLSLSIKKYLGLIRSKMANDLLRDGGLRNHSTQYYLCL